MSLSAILIIVLVLAIFVGALSFVINRLLDEPLRKWAWCILVVLVAVILIDILLGGSVLGLHWKTIRS